MKQFIEFLSALIQQTGKKAQQHAQIDELLSLIMPPPHLTARVIHGWLIIINNHPPHVRLAPQKLLLTKLLFHQTRLCVFFFFFKTATKERRLRESHFSVQRLNSFQ
jgi:hypothetical protein